MLSILLILPCLFVGVLRNSKLYIVFTFFPPKHLESRKDIERIKRDQKLAPNVVNVLIELRQPPPVVFPENLFLDVPMA